MSKKFWSFKNKADTNSAALMLYGIISSTSWLGDKVTPKQFKSELDALGDIDELDVFINSDGGDVFSGQAIYSMLKRHPAKVNVYIDGLAASIASVVAMAGDVVHMPSNSMMMIHMPWTLALGNADEFRKLADDLDKISESIVAAYQSKTPLSKDKIIEMMSAETWLTAEEAVKLGFADMVEREKLVSASINDGTLILNGQQLDISKYPKAPKLAFIPSENVDEPDEKLNTDTLRDEQEDILLSLFSKHLMINKNRLEAYKYE